MQKLSYLSIASLPNQCFFITGGVDLEEQIIYPNFTGGRIYGDDQSSVLSCCETYDFTLKKWQFISQLNIPRFSQGMIQVNGKIYVFGGNDGKEDLCSFEIFNQDTLKWDLIILENSFIKIRDPYLITEDNQNVIILSMYNDDNDSENEADEDQDIKFNQLQLNQSIWKINLQNHKLQEIGYLEIQEYGKNIIYFNIYEKQINILNHSNKNILLQTLSDINIFNTNCIKLPQELNGKSLMRYATSQRYFEMDAGVKNFYPIEVCKDILQIFDENRSQILKSVKLDKILDEIIQIVELTCGKVYLLLFNVLEFSIEIVIQIEDDISSQVGISSQPLVSQFTVKNSEEFLCLLEKQNFIQTKCLQNISQLNNFIEKTNQIYDKTPNQCFQISRGYLKDQDIILNEYQINLNRDLCNFDDYYYVFVITDQGEYKVLTYSVSCQYFSLLNVNQQQYQHINHFKNSKSDDQIKAGKIQFPCFYRQCKCINIRSQKILLVGGIEEKSITGNAVKKVIIYDTNSQQFSYVQDMNQPRVNHQLVVQNNYILAIAGRTNFHQNIALQTVERYNYLEDKWEFTSPINQPRYNFAACNVNQKIYISGGTHNQDLLDSIEVFEGQDWKILPVKLPSKMEGLSMITQNFYEIVILGGQKIKKSKQIYILNVNDFSLHESKSKLNTGRSHFHAFNYKNKILLLGGKYNLEFDLEKITGILNTNILYSHLIKSDLSEFGGSLANGNFFNNISQPTLKESAFLNIFGQSGVYYLNLKSLELNHKQPIALSGNIIQDYQTAKYSHACNIFDGKVFVSGGLSQNDNQIVKDCFIYSTFTNTLEKVSSMNESRFFHCSIYSTGFVYVFAGRGYKNLQKQDDANYSFEGSCNDLTTILDSCEKFNLKSYQWETLPRLNFPRQSSVASIYQNKVYIIGGSNEQIKVQQIERLNENTDRWEIISFCLIEGVESFSSFWISDQEFIILGGEYDQISFKNREDKEAYGSKKSRLKEGGENEQPQEQDQFCDHSTIIILKMQIINFQRELTTLESPLFQIEQAGNYCNASIGIDRVQFIENFKHIIYYAQPSLYKVAYCDQSILFVLENQGFTLSTDQKEHNDQKFQHKFLVKMSIKPPYYYLIPKSIEESEDFAPYPFTQSY
ncbi:kelch motif protein (macronuclear) [Tetrahymena thermophila SB210]|uniref:Kelch motif protein n=1 Tax=Tetrahymena thermophila (strain SB210) TaxID=312017 RepID=Q23DM8_TETTS|nr:kelch motif protein [Tetrahymena thermophila SB210]EAR94470.2 kelch motif protein [Tetrahymena thermophila SB210]|eukprot:XP_001014658.2 kelch motif protein [Tetrahymena thermophila SB210]